MPGIITYAAAGQTVQQTSQAVERLGLALVVLVAFFLTALRLLAILAVFAVLAVLVILLVVLVLCRLLVGYCFLTNHLRYLHHPRACQRWAGHSNRW